MNVYMNRNGKQRDAHGSKRSRLDRAETSAIRLQIGNRKERELPNKENEIMIGKMGRWANGPGSGQNTPVASESIINVINISKHWTGRGERRCLGLNGVGKGAA